MIDHGSFPAFLFAASRHLSEDLVVTLLAEESSGIDVPDTCATPGDLANRVSQSAMARGHSIRSVAQFKLITVIS